MADFPTLHTTPPMISTFSRYSLGIQNRLIENLTVPAAKTWVANLAVYIPLAIPFYYPVQRVFWCNGSTITSTNVDMGIFNTDGVKLYSTGSTAMSGASALQFVALGTPMLLSPGMYYLGWSCNNTTNRGFATAIPALGGRLMGLLQESSAFALPATATFAAWDATGFLQVLGITRMASGF